MTGVPTLVRVSRRRTIGRAVALLAAAVTGLCIAAPASAQTPVGSLLIRAVTAPGESGARFTFVVTCSGEGDPLERTIDVQTTEGVGTGTLDGLPVDMACLVTDAPAAGWRVGTVNPQAFVPSAEGTAIDFAHVARPAAAAAKKAALRVIGRADKDSAPEGETVTYAIEVLGGAAPQQDVTVTDVVPANAEYVRGSAKCPAPCSAGFDAASNTVTWTLGSLGADAKASGLTFQARIRPLTVNPDGSLPGTVVLNSAVASSELTPATTSNEVKTIVVAVLGKKVVRPAPPAVVTKPTKPIAAAPAKPTLPATGPRDGMLAVAIGLIVAGAALLLSSRRWSAR